MKSRTQRRGPSARRAGPTKPNFARLILLVTNEQREALEAKAAGEGITLSDAMRRHLTQHPIP